ncbi:sulfatase [Lentisphaera marina]|uniref:sulfatase family protein n=1 Tax=Lentisphaera marina TaxID=1111041 RepID=UPI002365455D|nr:sulfatase [Lentisphaera marina]MDD7985599.1 sulfatase [Lentisphaera marina]
MTKYSQLFLFLFTLSIFASKPNIFFIFSDDHATQAISAYGSKINSTPNIDRIANEGIRFDRCLVTNAICGPSRATILTGKYSHLNGFYKNDMYFNGDQVTFPKLLRKAGYQTAVIGKWHLATLPTGFDHFEVITGYGGQGKYYHPIMNKNGKPTNYRAYTTEIITELNMDWLKNQRDPTKPFMLMMQHKAPHRAWLPSAKYMNAFKDKKFPEPSNLHTNYKGKASHVKKQDMMIKDSMNPGDLKLTPPKYLDGADLANWHEAYDDENAAFAKAKLSGKALRSWNYQRYIRDYVRCVQSIDDSIGEVLAYLDESGLAENTLVIYSSDQGFFLGEHGWFDKRFMYEEALRTPLVMRWPGKIKAGSSNSLIVSNLDFAQTFLDVAGVTAPDEMQGASLLPLMRDKKPKNWRSSFYYHYYGYPDWHLVQKHCGVTDGRYKLIHFYTTDEWELYDMEKDPRENQNRASDPEFKSILDTMRKKLTHQRIQLKVPSDQELIEKFKNLEKENSYLKWGVKKK